MTAAERLCVTACGPGVEFDQVSLTLGRTPILDHVSFSIRPGSVHALVGPNGGGKSSLIKTLLGQMPHQGRLCLNWPGEPGLIGYEIGRGTRLNSSHNPSSRMPSSA